MLCVGLLATVCVRKARAICSESLLHVHVYTCTCTCGAREESMASCSQYIVANTKPIPASIHVVVGAMVIQPARRDRRDYSADM